MKEDSGRDKASKIVRQHFEEYLSPESWWNLLISPQIDARHGTHTSEPFEAASHWELKIDLGSFSTSPTEAHLSVQAKPELNLGHGYMLRKSQTATGKLSL